MSAIGSLPASAPYCYSKLTDRSSDIRLLKILPAQFGDPIKMNIFHVELKNVFNAPHRKPLTEVKATLPQGWHVNQSSSGRFIFSKKINNVWLTSWDHPCQISIQNNDETTDEREDTPLYEALSYTWGTKEDTEVATIVDDSGLMFEISIRKNLFSALQHLRLPDAPRTLWVDAICINQKDEAERDYQVSRMGNIFTNASRVIVWLGVEENNSSRALSVIEHLGNQIVACDDFSYWLPAPNADEPDWFDGAKCFLPYGDDDWQSIRDLTQRAWFFRRWVIQEVQLGNHESVVQCGPSRTTWNKFCTACAYMTFKGDLPWSLRQCTETVMHLAFDYRARSLCSHLVRFWDTQCEEPKDRIYAVLGIGSIHFQRLLRPQYALSVPETYRNAFLAESTWSNRLEFLPLCTTTRQITGPTWVPDLTLANPFKTLLGYQFSSGFAAADTHYETPDTLVVTGIECETVQKVSVPHTVDVIWERRSEWMPSKFSEDDLIQLVSCGYTNDRCNEWPTVEQWKSFYHGVADHGVHPLYIEKARNCLVGRSVFVAERFVGICPSGTLNGDMIAVILGLDSPIILRPWNGVYHVVGQCFVTDLRDSVSFLGPLPSSCKIEYHRSQNGQWRPFYVQNNTYTFDDPRLDALDGWISLEDMPSRVTSDSAAVFQNVISGEKVHSDPRITTEALKRRGVMLTSFRLV